MRIRTDFRDYISLMDMLKDKDIKSIDKVLILSDYFIDDVEISQPAIDALCDFMNMDIAEVETSQTRTRRQKNLFSFSVDYPYILSAFLRDYGIDLIDINICTGGNSGCFLTDYQKKMKLKKESCIEELI